jgi:hypothetical protein
MNYKTYNLFLDDVRMPSDCLTYMYDPRYGTREWVIVRSHEEFVSVFLHRWSNGEFPELVSFDHDLADEHYDPSMYHGEEKYNEAESKFTEKTGNESAKFFVQFCIDQSIALPECLVHSMNPIGRDKIKNTLKDYARYHARISNR